MTPSFLALALVFTGGTLIIPALYSASQRNEYGALIAVAPVVPVLAVVLWKFVPWAFREDDAHLMQLLSLFDASESVNELREMGVLTVLDLEYITPERLNGMKLKPISKSKLEDALRSPPPPALPDRAAVPCNDCLLLAACMRSLLYFFLIVRLNLRRHARARGWKKQVYTSKDEKNPGGTCSICDKPEDEHHGVSKHCSKRCAEVAEKLLAKEKPQLYKACSLGDVHEVRSSVLF